MEELKGFIFIVSGTIGVFTVGWHAARWFGRKDAEDKITARDLDRKADTHRLEALERRMDDKDRVIERFEDLMRAGLAGIRDELREEHQKRGLQNEKTGVELQRIAIELATMQQAMKGFNDRLDTMEQRVDRRRQSPGADPA